MRVALCITIYNSHRFLKQQFYYLSKLDSKPSIIYFVENNSQDDSVEWIRKNAPNLGIPFKLISYKMRKDATKWLVDHGGTHYDVIAIARQIGLALMRKDRADWGIFIDDDLYMTEPDALLHLTQYDGYDIIGGTYSRVYPEGMFVASKWGTTIPHRFKLKKLNEVTKPCDFPAITSGGCMVLSKRLMQDTSLRFYPVNDSITGNSASEDYGYCIRATAKGYKLILDNSTNLHHMAMETIEDRKPWTIVNGKYIDFSYEGEKHKKLHIIRK